MAASCCRSTTIKPFAVTAAEIAEIASQVRDRNYRIEVAEDGIHVYNAKGHHVAADALSLYPKLGVESDGAHAFYLAQELMKAEIAFRSASATRRTSRSTGASAADRRRKT